MEQTTDKWILLESTLNSNEKVTVMFNNYEWKQVILLLKVKSESEVAQSCPTLCDPMDWSLPGSSIRGIFQARTLEWVAISFSRGSSKPRDRTHVSRIAGRHFTIWANWEARYSYYLILRK